MNRREFINRSTKVAAGALITGGLTQCIRRDDIFYPSLDNGITWTNQQQSVDIGSQGTFDTSSLGSPAVIKDGSTYKMWYTGSNGNGRVIYCESSDGITWSNFQLSINISSEGTFDTVFSQTPSIIKDGSTYRMWYAGNNANNRIIYCESSDGISGSNFQMVINLSSQGANDVNGALGASVIKENGAYTMWYTGRDAGNTDRIIYCNSSDGINWSNFQMVVNISSHGIYDTSQAEYCSVIKDNGTYKMWYTGNDGTNDRIIYCTSSNGINWSNFQLSVNIGSQGTLDTTGVNHPSVINENGVGKMWYGGSNGINRILYTESR